MIPSRTIDFSIRLERKLQPNWLKSISVGARRTDQELAR
jgi:hypothetical protein